MKAIIFPGQGSQHRGMGNDVFDLDRDLVQQANDILGYDIAETCRTNPNRILDQTEVTQPAVYVVSSLYYRQLSANGDAPTFLAGHSLGEYAALAAADVFSFSEGLKLVRRRGALMGDVDGGGLVAIIGMKRGDLENMLEQLPGVEIANINAPEQIVVGGRKDKLQLVLEACAQRSVRAIPLRVSGAFHTSEMKRASDAFAVDLKALSFRPPRIPVLSNVTGRVHDASGIAEALIEQMVRPVLWCDCVQTMIAAGVTEFVEVGKTRVLTPLIEKIKTDAIAASLAESASPSSADPAATSPGPTAQTAAPAHALAPLQERQANAPAQSWLDVFQCQRRIVAGGIGHGISGVSLVRALAKDGVLSFLDTEGLSLDDLRKALSTLNGDENVRGRFGVSVLASASETDRDENLVNLLLEQKIDCIEARGYAHPTAALIRFRNECQSAKVLARVGSRGAAVAFMVGGQTPSAAPNTLPSANSAPWAQAICVDLQAWRCRAAADFGLLLELAAWRDAHQQSVGRSRFFVGASGAAHNPKSIAFLLAEADFAVLGSFYLITQEANLAATVKTDLINSAICGNVPDWSFPELNSRSWSVACSQEFLDAADQLYNLYVSGAATAGDWDQLGSTLPSNFLERISDLRSTLARTKNSRQFRAQLRTASPALLFPSVIPCDAPQLAIRAPHSGTSRSLSSPPTCAELSDYLCPLS